MESTVIKPWWDYLEFTVSDRGACIDDDWTNRCLSVQALKHGLKVDLRSYRGGIVIPEGTAIEDASERIKQKLTELGGHAIVDDPLELIFVWERAAFRVVFFTHEHEFTGDGAISFGSTDPTLVEPFELLAEDSLEESRPPRGKAFVLLDSGHGMHTQEIGVGSCPLVRENYRPEVVEGYDQIVASLREENPFGRLFILDGQPGVGKTYLIRALLNDLPKLKFLLLPSSMAASMAGPELLSTLISASGADESSPKVSVRRRLKKTRGRVISAAKYAEPQSQNSGKHPLVLVIEDADSCLSSRASDNISAISNILNMSEGLIGNLLDLRIICTTNVKSQEIDSAIMRNGRLSARIEVGLLDRKQAEEVFHRVSGQQVALDDATYTLADIYALAKGKPAEVVPIKRKKAGFGT